MKNQNNLFNIKKLIEYTQAWMETRLYVSLIQGERWVLVISIILMKTLWSWEANSPHDFKGSEFKGRLRGTGLSDHGVLST